MAAVPSVLLRPDSGTLRSGNHGDGALSRCSLTAGLAGAARRSATSSTTVSGSPGSTNQTARKSSNHAPFPREEQLSITAAAAAFVSKTPPSSSLESRTTVTMAAGGQRTFLPLRRGSTPEASPAVELWEQAPDPAPGCCSKSTRLSVRKVGLRS